MSSSWHRRQAKKAAEDRAKAKRQQYRWSRGVYTLNTTDRLEYIDLSNQQPNEQKGAGSVASNLTGGQSSGMDAERLKKYMEQFENQYSNQKLTDPWNLQRRITFTQFASPATPPNQPMATAIPKPSARKPTTLKVGDKVKLLKHNGGSAAVMDEEGEIKAIRGDIVFMTFPSHNEANGNGLYEAPKSYVALITPSKPRPKVSFDSVIMPEHKRQQILDALEQINQHDLIFDVWGFGETIEKGRGVSMLFHGPPGTGKTLVAQAIADKLDKKLVVISTADVESAHPGEAERNIRKHFKDAKDGKNVLLFDECDSLLYSRQSVGAIMGAQINELLSQLERFDGITLFTTNRLGTLDEAVNRRLALKLQFDMPSTAERIKIWQRMFPEKAPLAKDIDWERLAVVEITGGYIKNAVMRAARMAAAEKVAKTQKKIKMEHLVQALRLEAESMIEFEDAKDAHNGRGVTFVRATPVQGEATGTSRRRVIEGGTA